MDFKLDAKRGTGRTSRMLLEAAKYLVSNPDDTAVIVGHTRGAMLEIQTLARSILGECLYRRLRWNYYSNYKIVGSSRDVVFYDHHCFYKELNDLQMKLNATLAEYTKYD